HPHELPPFPTRRSSDLHAFDKQMAAQGHAGDAYGQAVVYRSDAPVAAAKLGAVACLIRSVGGAECRIPHTGQTNYKDGVPKIPADRKSTRLNSSHSQIS